MYSALFSDNSKTLHYYHLQHLVISAWKKNTCFIEVPNEALEDVIIDFRLSLNFCVFFGELVLFGKP